MEWLSARIIRATGWRSLPTYGKCTAAGVVPRALAATVLAVLVLSSCSTAQRTGTGAPDFFGTWEGLRDSDVGHALFSDGRASVTSMPISNDEVCDPANATRVTADGAWRVDDHNFVVVSVEAGDIVVIPSQRFGIADWESISVGECGHATPQGSWIEFIGGDHTLTGSAVPVPTSG